MDCCDYLVADIDDVGALFHDYRAHLVGDIEEDGVCARLHDYRAHLVPHTMYAGPGYR